MPSDFDSDRPKRRRSWFHYAVGGGLLLLALVFLAGIATLGVITWRVRTSYFAAQNSIDAELARIHAAGEPFSAPEMYAFHRVPAGTSDATAAWLNAIATFEHEELEADINALPLFGEGTTAVLPAQLTPKDAAAVAGLFDKYASTIDAVAEAAREPGECRLPIKFEDEFIGNRVPSLKIYWLVRLLGLKAQRQQAAGDTDGAIETLTTMLAACSTLKRQPHGLDHGRRLASMSNVLRHVYWLMHDVQLDERQLATLQSKLDEADYDGSLTIALLGNRAMWYPYFLKNAEAPGVVQITEGDKSSEEPGRPQDCELTLRFAARMIAASRQPFPQALE
jgi:hypothetical protein